MARAIVIEISLVNNGRTCLNARMWKLQAHTTQVMWSLKVSWLSMMTPRIHSLVTNGTDDCIICCIDWFQLEQYDMFISDKMGLKRPAFSPNIMTLLKPLMVMDNYHGILAVLYDWLVIVGCTLSTNWLIRRNYYMGLLIYPISVLLIGVRMRALSLLLHESTHRTLAKSKILNDILGSVFSGWCVLHSWSGYHHHHILFHHPHLGDPNKDPDYMEFNKTGLYSEGTTRVDVINYLKSIPTPRSTLMYACYLIKYRIYSETEKRFERILRLSFCIAMIGVLYQTGNMRNFVFYWVIPQLTTANWVGIVAESFEHFPLLHKDVDELHASRNWICGTIGSVLINSHGEVYHLVHHLFPRMPHWNLTKAHEVLMEDENDRAVHQCKVGFIAQLQDILSHFD